MSKKPLKLSNVKEVNKKFVKSKKVEQLIDNSIALLTQLGLPMEVLKLRRRQRVAMAFLAVAGVKQSINEVKVIKTGQFLGSRVVLQYWNDNFEEQLKDSSYDDVRSENLDFLVLGGIAFNSGDLVNGAKNDARRGFSLTDETIVLLKSFKDPDWNSKLKTFLSQKKTLKEELERKRGFSKIQIALPNGFSFDTNPDKHNQLQKALVENFLPIFAKSAMVLYIGDASKREQFHDKENLKKLGFFDISHSEMPDIIAYDEINNWFFLIEAYHSTGEWDELRVLKIKRKLSNISDRLIFITGFLDRETFKSKASNIAWETEVWIADNPEHLIHFNGHKFLGPYKS